MGGGVRQWYIMFGQHYSISVVKQCFSASNFGGGARLKGVGAPYYHLRETLIIIYLIMIKFNYTMWYYSSIPTQLLLT